VDYYVRPHDATAGCQYGSCDGTSYANAWEGFSGGNGTPVNWTTVDTGNGKLFVAGDHREAIQVGSPGYSGESGFPINILPCLIANGASTDDQGTLYSSERYADTDWTLWYNSGGVKIWRVFLTGVETSIYPASSTDGGTTWSLVKMKARSTAWSTSTIQSSLPDHYYYQDASNDGQGWDGASNVTGDSYAYYRDDSATANTDLADDWELGHRRHVFKLDSVSWITIDGHRVIFPTGANAKRVINSHAIEMWGSTAQPTDNIVIQNNEFGPGGTWVVNGYTSEGGGEFHNHTYQNNYLHSTHAGFHLFGQGTDYVQYSQTCDNINIIGNTIENFGNTPEMQWDREAVGVGICQNVTVEKNYIKNNVWDERVDESGQDNCTAFFGVSGLTFTRNYVESCGDNALGSIPVFIGAEYDYVGGDDVEISYNIIDGWQEGPDCTAAGGNGFNALDIGGDWSNYIKPENCGPGCAADGGYLRIYGNLIMNPKDWRSTCNGNYHYADGVISIRSNKWDSIDITNNVIVDHPDNYTPALAFHVSSVASYNVRNNNFYITDGMGISTTNWPPVDGYWAHDKISGETSGFYEYDMSVTHNAANIYDEDPGLASTTKGAANIKKPAGGSVMIDSGYNLGATYDDGLDAETSDFTANPPTVNTRDQDSFGSGWEMGPYVFACVPETPSITDPTPSETGVPLNREVDSSAFADQSGCSTSHVSSDWEICSNSICTAVVDSTYDDTSNKITWTPGLPGNSQLYIRVRHTNSTSDSPWSSTVYFETVGAPPSGGGLALLVTGDNNTFKWILVDCEAEESTGIKANAGATGNIIYNSTVVDCGEYGLDLNEAITLKNVLAHNNAGPDIDYTGVTVTAGNNSFEDANPGGGTYNSATSDWSREETFYDFANDDFKLRRSSYGVDKGTSTIYSGTEYDIVSRQATDASGDPVSGAGIDIGAWESEPFLQHGPMSMGLGYGLN
jgi:hypothetical protein